MPRLRTELDLKSLTYIVSFCFWIYDVFITYTNKAAGTKYQLNFGRCRSSRCKVLATVQLSLALADPGGMYLMGPGLPYWKQIVYSSAIMSIALTLLRASECVFVDATSHCANPALRPRPENRGSQRYQRSETVREHCLPKNVRLWWLYAFMLVMMGKLPNEDEASRACIV